MKKTAVSIILFTIFTATNCKINLVDNKSQESSISFSVNVPPKEYEKLKCQILLIGKDKLLEQTAKILKEDLEFTDQLKVDLKITKNKLDNKTEAKILEQYEVPILGYISKNKNMAKLEIKNLVYNTTIFEKEFEIKKGRVISSTHKVSNKLLPQLTGEKSLCLHSLAYCKMLSPKHKVICVSDYLGKHPKTIIKSRVNVSPSWHTKAPVLYYSQILANKVSLNSFDFSKKRNSVISSYDGLNMQPSFSSNGTKAALCLSDRVNPLSQIYLYDYALCKKMQKRVFIKLTSNNGNNVSPCMLPDENIIFCSDYRTRLPQIYHLEKKTKKITRITNGRGYCAAPSYCPKNNNLVYTRLINGTFQLFTINLENLIEKQITFSPGNKHEPDISPCGNFVVFSLDKEYKKGHTTQQIAVLNCKSGKIRTLTTGKEPKSFPRWSKIPILI